MTFDQLWQQLVQSKPLLSDPKAKITITSGAFKKLLRTAWSAGAAQDSEAMEEAAKDFAKVGVCYAPWRNVLDEIFGRR